MKLLAALAALACTGSALAGPTIETIAPRNSVLVWSISNLSETVRRAEHTPLGDLWSAGQDQLPEAGMDLFPEEMHDMLEQLKADPKQPGIPRPEGAVGMAVFTIMNQELGLPEPAFIALADYGEQAPAAERWIDSSLERAREGGKVKLLKRELLDHTVYSVDLPHAEVDLDEEMDFGDPDGGPFGMMPSPGDLLGHIQTLHLVRSGSSLLLSSDLGALVGVLKRQNGEGEPVLADNPNFQRVVGELGATDGYAVALTANMLDLTSVIDPMGMAMMFTPMLRAAFGDVRGMGYGVNLAAADSAIEHRVFFDMPAGKQGIPSLMSAPLTRRVPPSFVKADVLSYASLSMQFDRMLPMMQRLLQSNPMLMAQMGQEWNDMQRSVQPLLSSLGSEVHFVQSTGGGSDSHGLTAVDYRQRDQFASAFAEYARGQGMEKKVLDGRDLYTMVAPDEMAFGAPGMLPIAMPEDQTIGVGEHFLFMGPEAVVRLAMESDAAAPGGSLADDVAFIGSVKVLEPLKDVVAWGYSRSVDRSLVGELGGGHVPDVKMGSAVWALQSTEKGFLGTMYQLTPDSKVTAGGAPHAAEAP